MLKPFCYIAVHQYDSFLISLTDDPELSVNGIYLADIQIADLGNTHPGLVNEFQDGSLEILTRLAVIKTVKQQIHLFFT